MDIYEEKRPWGSFRRFTNNEISTVKILSIKAGEALSLQYHDKRDEFWRVLSGSPDIIVGERKETAHVGDEFFITRGIHHRILAPDEDAQILEIAFGEFDENDIVRLEDDYHRV
jgi:mannose-1-phosphate guanylyltransferase/mannose-1-phosphate guanylyltransferase/mannose-6-phosphate isomerase